MSQHIDAAIEDALALRRVQLMDELCGVVLVGLLIPVETKGLSGKQQTEGHWVGIKDPSNHLIISDVMY